MLYLDQEMAVSKQAGVLLLVHGEVTAPEIDMFDREEVFIERVLQPLLEKLPDLRVVLEHISTRQAVEFVQSASANVAASITPQHMLLNRNALFQVILLRIMHFMCISAPAVCSQSQHATILESDLHLASF